MKIVKQFSVDMKINNGELEKFEVEGLDGDSLKEDIEKIFCPHLKSDYNSEKAWCEDCGGEWTIDEIVKSFLKKNG